MKKVIAVDVDDVVWGFNEAFVPYINAEFGLSLSLNDLTTFAFHEIVGLPKDEIVPYYEDFTHRHHHTIKLTPDAAVGLHKLQQMGYDLQYVTNRCESAKPFTDGHLEELGVRKYFSDGFHTNGVSRKFPERKRLKSAVCSDINAITLVDDAIENVVDVSQVCGIPALLFSRRWNEHLKPLPRNVYRVKTWTDIVGMFQKSVKTL